MTLHYRSGYCSASDCPHKGKEILLVNVSRQLCMECNQKRLRENKPKRKVYSPKPRKPISRKPMKKKFRVATGEGEMFRIIWEIRPHICVNCKIPLGDEMRTFYFSHRVPKSRGEKYRLNPANIDLLCFPCHRARDQGTSEQYSQRTRE